MQVLIVFMAKCAPLPLRCKSRETGLCVEWWSISLQRRKLRSARMVGQRRFGRLHSFMMVHSYTVLRHEIDVSQRGLEHLRMNVCDK